MKNTIESILGELKAERLRLDKAIAALLDASGTETPKRGRPKGGGGGSAKKTGAKVGRPKGSKRKAVQSNTEAPASPSVEAPEVISE